MSTPASTTSARELFAKHGGMLRTGKAIRLGIHPRTLYALRDTGLTKLNQDIVVPRSRLEDLFRFATRLQKKHNLQIACFGHGDPLISGAAQTLRTVASRLADS